MGQNSTEISYQFGQMGSVFTNLAKPVWPPKDHVIVAIQFLAENTPTVLETETLDSHGPQFPTHQDDELASAGGPDANYLGVVEAPATSGVAATGVITLTSEVAATNALIKPGQVVLIGADGDTIDAGITVDTAAGHIDPIYNGPNKQWLEVVSISGTALTVKGVGKGTTANLGSIDTSNTLYFLDNYHGAGGTTTEGTAFPSGTTIYGRWSTVTPSAAACICYFGK
tara:strand:+ start:1254 stop:1934 length:681 start_codon:yes stop_codon:yes gene_type:complete